MLWCGSATWNLNVVTCTAVLSTNTCITSSGEKDPAGVRSTTLTPMHLSPHPTAAVFQDTVSPARPHSGSLSLRLSLLGAVSDCSGHCTLLCDSSPDSCDCCRCGVRARAAVRPVRGIESGWDGSRGRAGASAERPPPFLQNQTEQMHGSIERLVFAGCRDDWGKPDVTHLQHLIINCKLVLWGKSCLAFPTPSG